MKKDDILILRLVSVAVLLAALALIILLGVRYNIYTKIGDNITAGVVTNSQGRYPLYAEQYYKGVNVIYQVMYALLVYTSVISIVGIFFRIKGTPAIAKAAGIMGIVTGVFLILSKLFEKNELINRMFSRIFLGQSVHYNKVLDGVSAVPARAVIFGVLLILIGAFSLIMLKKSHIAGLKIYNKTGSSTGAVLLMPVLYGIFYVDIIRQRLLAWIFSYTNLSAQIFGILDEYYLKDIFFLSFDKIIVIVAVALLSVGLYKLGLKKKLVRFVVNIPVVVLSAAGFIMLLANPKRLFGYVSLDEAVCDRVETVGTIAALVMATDMIVIGIMTAQCLDLSGKVSQTRLLGIASVLVFVSIMAVLAGYFVTEMSVYIALLVINVLGIAALLLFTGARKK